MSRPFALPGSRPRYAADRPVDTRHIRLDLDVDLGARSIAGRCSLTFSPLTPSVRHLRLDAAELDIERVTLADEPLAFRYDGAELSIELARTLAEGEMFTLDIDYRATPRRGLYFIQPDAAYPDKPVQVWTQSQDEDARHWFPCFDAPHEKATSELIATVPASMFAISNGELVRDEAQGDRRRVHWRLDEPHPSYLVTLAVGAFSSERAGWRDVELTYYGPPGSEDALRRTAGRTPEMLERFSQLFRCPYPYGKYDQVFVADFIFGGMENTTATTLTDLVLLDERAAIDADSEGLLAHELAHQWFGDLLTCRTWSEGWLNEGFASYAEYLWREHADGRDAADVELDGFGRQYYEEASARYQRPVVCNVYDEPLDIFDHHLYRKGARVLHMLRGALGDDAFFRSIGHYAQKHSRGSVETRDLARAIEDATGRVLDWFFDQWIFRAGHPELEVRVSWDAERACVIVDVEQTQAANDRAAAFRLPTAVAMRVPGEDADRVVPIELSEPRSSFALPLPAPPEQVVFDPGKQLLAPARTQKGLDLWLAELAGATAAIDRISAAREIGKRGGAQATRALAGALASDPFWGVRAEAATALGEIRTAEARDALLSAWDAEEHPRARRGIARGLGAFSRDEAAAEHLARIVSQGDASYFVEAEACLSLGKTRDARAPELLMAAAERDSFRDVIRDGAYRGLAAAREESALPWLLSQTGYGRPPLGRRSALLAAAELAAGRTDRDARDARERAEELLRDVDFRVQGAAVEALRTIGDPASISALRDLVSRELDGRLLRRAREVARDLEDGSARGEENARLRDQVEALRTEVGELRARIDRLAPASGSAEAEPADEPSGARRPSPRRTPTRRKGGKKTVPTA